MSITRNEVTHLLLTNDRAVARALVVLYQRQTADEQSAASTRYSNGVGFNATDAKLGSDLAKRVIEGWRLTPGQMAAARRMLIKYGGQLVAAAEAKAASRSSV